MPRKSKFNARLSASLCSWLRKGCSYKDACAMEGISYETFRTWEKEKPAFSASLKKAEAVCKMERIRTILTASQKSWQAAAWWLERRCPEEYGRTDKREEEPRKIVTIEELEEAGRQQEEATRCKTIEEVRAKMAEEKITSIVGVSY